VELQSAAVTVQRRVLCEMRREGVIDHDVFHKLEGELDIIELTADPRVRCCLREAVAGPTILRITRSRPLTREPRWPRPLLKYAIRHAITGFAGASRWRAMLTAIPPLR
jgi:hypothetical protein